MQKSTQSFYAKNRQTHRIDAADQPLGRLATKVANILRGKNKATFTPQVDNGDFVIVENVSKMKFTGKKLEQKVYKYHTRHPGGLRVTKLSKLAVENPGKVLNMAVTDMLPRIKTRKNIMMRLTIK